MIRLMLPETSLADRDTNVAGQAGAAAGGHHPPPVTGLSVRFRVCIGGMTVKMAIQY